MTTNKVNFEKESELGNEVLRVGIDINDIFDIPEDNTWDMNLSSNILRPVNNRIKTFIHELQHQGIEVYVYCGSSVNYGNRKKDNLKKELAKKLLRLNGIKADSVRYTHAENTSVLNRHKIDTIIYRNKDDERISNAKRLSNIVFWDEQNNDNLLDQIKSAGKFKIKKPVIDETKLTLPSKDGLHRLYYDEEQLNSKVIPQSLYDAAFGSEEYPDQIIIDYLGREYSKAEIKKNIQLWQRSFERKGIKEGQVVTLCMANYPEHIYAKYALTNLGAIVHELDPRLPENQLQQFFDEANSTYLIAADAVYARLRKHIDKKDNIRECILIDPSLSMPAAKKMLYPAIKKAELDKKNNELFDLFTILDQTHQIYQLVQITKQIRTKIEEIRASVNPFKNGADEFLDYFENTIEKIMGNIHTTRKTGMDENNKTEFKNNLKKLAKINHSTSVDNHKLSEKCIKPEVFLENAEGLEESIPIAYDPDRIIFMEHTGGTSGRYKLATFSAGRMNSLVHSYQNCNKNFSIGDSIAGIMPMFIIYGTNVGTHMALCSGVKIFQYPKLEEKEFYKMLVKLGINHFVGTKGHGEYMMNDHRFQGKDLSDLGSLNFGGSKVVANIKTAINESWLPSVKANITCHVGYGSTECGATVLRNYIDCDSVDNEGIPFADVVIKIVKPGTQIEVGYGEQGEICVHCGNRMNSYYKNKEETDKVLQTHEDGLVYVHTGDLGIANKDGTFTVFGRMNGVFPSKSGWNVIPFEVESALMQHEAVKEAVVIEIPGEEEPIAFMCLNDGYENTPELISEINMLCSNTIDEYMIPTIYEVLEEIPVTKNGKDDRMESLKELATHLNELRMEQEQEVYTKKLLA